MDHDKKKRSSRKTMTAAEAFTSILQAARDLRIRGDLTPGKQKMAREAAFVLNTPQSTRVRQSYRIFLCDTYEKCGPHGVLLCAVQLGQHRSMTMRKSSREDLINVMESNKENAVIKCPEIESCAREYGIYRIQETDENLFALDENLDSNLLQEPGYRECLASSGQSWDDHWGYGLCSVDITSSLYDDTMPGLTPAITPASTTSTDATDHILESFPPRQDPRPWMMATSLLPTQHCEFGTCQGVRQHPFPHRGGAIL